MTVITARDVPDAKAYLDGVEVSSLCTAADPDEGWVDLISDGWKADENGQIITERKYGDVRIEMPVTFTIDEVVYQSRELDTSGSGSPFVKL